MSVQDILHKIKPRIGPAGSMEPEVVSFDANGQVEHPHSFRFLFWPATLLLVATLSFGVGRLAATANRPEMKITFDPVLAGLDAKVYQGESLANDNSNTASVINSQPSTKPQTGDVFASSKGKKYYYPGCKNTIIEKNKVTFATKEIAEAAGYTLAANCKPK